jgi:hypothetical protein
MSKVYRCDRCKKDLTVRYVVTSRVARSTDVLSWDLCRECTDLVLLDHGLTEDAGHKLVVVDAPE